MMHIQLTFLRWPEKFDYWESETDLINFTYLAIYILVSAYQRP